MVEEWKVAHLKGLICDYLEGYTSRPAMESIEENIFVAYKLGNILMVLMESNKLIGTMGYDFSAEQSSATSEDDIQRLKEIVEGEECSECDIDFLAGMTGMTCSKKCLLPYIDRQMNWVVISILSASYLSSTILMRSLFEILVNLSTTADEGMGEKIDNIPFIQKGEGKQIKKMWRQLCSWSHPYKKWLRDICPIYMEHRPIYHPKHFEECVDLLEKVIDLYLVVCKEHFGMDVSLFADAAIKHPIDLSNFPLFRGRIEGGSG